VNNNTLPHVTVILAISLDGKISLDTNTPARFSSAQDLVHLEEQISLCDAIVFGANTLRAYGTSLTIKNPQLLRQRQQAGKPPQPLNIVCSTSGNLNPDWSFFSQPLPRALLTCAEGKETWFKQLQSTNLEEEGFFQQYFISEPSIAWREILIELKKSNYDRIGILGGAKLISSLLPENLIDDIWLTICPVIMGQINSPSWVEASLLAEMKKPIPLTKLLAVKQIENEIFVHYSLKEDV
jgi:riboflavin-specific deaminase-like protein